jgi:hypothetical protein
MNFDASIALTALLLHFLWVAWVVLGWVWTRRRALLRWFHIASLVYSILIELFRWPCPLTLVEVEYARRAGWATYQKPFLVHYLEQILYPELPESVVIVGAVVACAAILALYGWRYSRRDASGW